VPIGSSRAVNARGGGNGMRSRVTLRSPNIALPSRASAAVDTLASSSHSGSISSSSPAGASTRHNSRSIAGFASTQDATTTSAWSNTAA